MTTGEERRESAIKRLNQKRDLRSHFLVFIVVNTMLIVIWAATGGGYFWPVWPIGGWGIGLILQAVQVYFGPKPFSESDIEAEMRRDAPRDAT